MLADSIQDIKIQGVHYKVNYIIGEGGAGIVYHVTCETGEDFALKMVRNYTKNPMLRQAVDCEIKIQQMFSHQKYVIKYYGEKVVDNNVYILFELGQYSLRNKIEMNHLVQDEYIQMLIDVSYGIKSIHDKKAQHRDIKPENIIYAKGMFKITDFGTSTHNEKSNEMAGTCIYWAPELIYDEIEEYTQAIDIWSFGVLAFEAYFLIHPFFYDSSIKSNVVAMEELKKNIEVLTPNFQFDKLINHLKKNGYKSKAEFIEKKLIGTNESLINCFKGIFVKQPSQRLDINILVAIFESIQLHHLNTVQIRTSRVINQKQVFPEIDYFVQALNLSYKLNHDFKYKYSDEVEFSIELALRFLTLRAFKGKDFINYHCGQKVLKYDKPSKEKEAKIVECLSEYFFYLKETKDIQFFSDLAILRVLVLMCCFYNNIRDNSKAFLKKMNQITGIPSENLSQFRQVLPALTERQFASIENLILNEYFK